MLPGLYGFIMALYIPYNKELAYFHHNKFVMSNVDEGKFEKYLSICPFTFPSFFLLIYYYNLLLHR